LILTITSFSCICAYVMIFFYYKVYTSALEQASLSVKIGYEMLIGIYAVICYATNHAIIWLFRQCKTEQEEDRQREIFSRQMQDLESHITEAERLYKDMRALRHDVGNHLMTLKQLYTRGEYEEAEKYADSLTCEMQKASIGARSGNPVTDVILSERRKEMEEKGIDFTSDFHYPADSGINAFDISIVLNNGLSNAIEAIERNNLPAPHISLYSYHMKNMYIIEITNSFTGELEADEWNGLPLTTKTGDGHGFGLSSIRQVANKYLGDMEIGKERYKQEERCVLRVMLQIAD
ncbi:MAG: GHKL domain-containing protein, partial [Schaedlerella sp.]|uniref:sensor histidine kinase n=1 Tax=Schaedlerella sp. TaxID=2676057 RepID=UPI003527EA3F